MEWPLQQFPVVVPPTQEDLPSDNMTIRWLNSHIRLTLDFYSPCSNGFSASFLLLMFDLFLGLLHVAHLPNQTGTQEVLHLK